MRSGMQGRRLRGGRRWLLAALVVAVLALTAGFVWEAWSDTRGPTPDVVLGSGSIDGREWVYGYDEDETFVGGSGEVRCFELVIDRTRGGCGRYTQPVESLVVYHSSSGAPEGLLTAEGVASDEVARVVCGTGSEAIGQTHVFEMPGDELRPVLCLATADEVAGREWFAFAFDAQGREIAKSDGLPQR
jgi:hypothetical protein